MRGDDTFTESLFTMGHLDDFVPQSHPLHPVRLMVSQALKNLEPLLTSICAADMKVVRPSIAPVNLLRAMLLQVSYSNRSERMLMEQTQYNLLFCRFIGLSIDNTVWVPTVFTKNRERLIERDAVIELFNEVMAIANKKDWLSDEHFSVDGALIQAWAGRKSFARKDGIDDDTGDFNGKKRSNDTHESTTVADAHLYRKGNTGRELRFMSHTLSDNRHGLISSAVVTTARGYGERETAKEMITDVKQVADADAHITLDADKGYDAAEFIEALTKVLRHVAQNTTNRKSAVPEHIAISDGYVISHQKRKLMEQGYGCAKFVGPIRQVMVRGLKKVDQLFVLTMAACNLTCTCTRALEEIRLQTK